MKKFWLILSIILAVSAIVLTFTPLVKSPLATLGWSTILVVSLPGLLTIVATVFALKSRVVGAAMFLILAAVFTYFLLTQLLTREYWIIAAIFFLAGIAFLFSRPRPQQDETLQSKPEISSS